MGEIAVVTSLFPLDFEPQEMGRAGDAWIVIAHRLLAAPGQFLLATLAQGRMTDLPGYCAPSFTLMLAAYTSRLSVQVSDFEDLCLLIQPCRLLCGFCSSGQRFACGFLQ